MIRALIIEDELDAQNLLGTILKDYCPNVALIDIATDLPTGIKLIEYLRPDLVFLDIQLGENTGFQLLDLLPWKNFKVIITTAHQDYALKAFEYEAIDYVLKPYSPKSIISAIARVEKTNQASQLFRRLDDLLNHKATLSRLQLATQEGIVMVSTSEIIRLEADRSYCNIFLKNGERLLVSRSLKDLESQLPSTHFFRIHTSHLINLQYLERYNKADGGFVVLADKIAIPIARRRKNEFLERINSHKTAYL